MLQDIDYAKLKRSFALFVRRFAPQELITPQNDPIGVLDRIERHSPSKARRGLCAAGGDLVEATQHFTAAQLADADAALQQLDAYTLSFLRSRFSRRRTKT